MMKPVSVSDKNLSVFKFGYKFYNTMTVTTDPKVLNNLKR